MTMNIPSICLQKTSVSHIKFEENHSRLIFVNSDMNEYERIRIDGCVIADDKPKCDDLLRRRAKDKSVVLDYFIELKGSDVAHAIEQLLATVKRFYGKMHAAVDVQAFAICTAIPKETTRVQILKKQCSAYSLPIHIKRSPYEHQL